MPLVSKGQLNDFSSAISTKNALEMVDQRKKSGGGVGMERSRTSAFIHTTGLSSPAYDTSGNLFGSETLGKTGYGLLIPQGLTDETLIEYVIDQTSIQYGQIEKTEANRVIIKPLTKSEFEAKQKEKGLPIVTFSKDDAEKLQFSPVGKIFNLVNNFFFPTADNDSVRSLLETLVKLILTAGMVVGGIGLVAYLVW